MSRFETVLLLSPEISTSIRKKICEDLTKKINENSGKVINTEDWGLRDLSYNINLTKL